MNKGLRTLNQAIALFRDLDPEIPATTIILFLAVAEAPEPIGMVDLQNNLGLPSSTTSRNVAYLSETHRLGKSGLGLIERYEDLHNRRAKLVRLTAKGRALKTRLINLIS